MYILLTVGILLGYAVMTVIAARWRYRVIRPYTEPVACYSWTDHEKYGHRASCYRRHGLTDTTDEAVLFALLTGLLWWAILPGMLVQRAVTAGAGELPQETRLKIKRLEEENERLRLEQEKS